MASGMARGAMQRGKKVAFGDGRQIKWDKHSAEIFRYNQNVARPGEEKRTDLEWIEFYKGHRLYNRDSPLAKRWIWNYDFKAQPGELIFSPIEKRFAESQGKNFVFVEPNIPSWKEVAPNKQWPIDRFDQVVWEFKKQDIDVVQPIYRDARHRLAHARHVATRDFRHAAALLSRACLYIGPEGGLHHAAAALGRPAVVIFGGFIPPQVTGYASHTNLTGGAEACGNYRKCDHCRRAMEKITVEEVIGSAMDYISVGAT